MRKENVIAVEYFIKKHWAEKHGRKSIPKETLKSLTEFIILGKSPKLKSIK